MPASLPGSTLAENRANPSAGRAVIFDPLSGPKGAPLDRDQAGNCSTGGLSNGIGFGPNSPVIGATAPASIIAAGFNDDQVPGARSASYGTLNTPLSRFLYIGAGRMIANVHATDKFSIPFVPSEYTAGVAIGAAGNGGSRDGGAGPAFTAFAMKMVTAAGAVANGAAIEAGFINRSGAAMVSGQSAHGSSATQLAAAS
jgi:hypothetical protein